MTSIRTIEIIDYDPAWATTFAELHRVIDSVLGDLALSIEHVGSTSVPGLGAKPIVDMNIVMESRDVLPSMIEALGTIGYVHKGHSAVPGRESFDREDLTVPTDGSGREWPNHHLYACLRGSDALHQHIALRDHLRAHPESAREYERIKREMARRYPHDIDSYIEGKSGFIRNILDNAPR